MVLMKIITLQATNPGKGMDWLGLNSSFYSSGFNQEYFQMTDGADLPARRPFPQMPQAQQPACLS